MTFCRIFQFSVYGSDQLNNEHKIEKQIGKYRKLSLVSYAYTSVIFASNATDYLRPYCGSQLYRIVSKHEKKPSVPKKTYT